MTYKDRDQLGGLVLYKSDIFHLTKAGFVKMSQAQDENYLSIWFSLNFISRIILILLLIKNLGELDFGADQGSRLTDHPTKEILMWVTRVVPTPLRDMNTTPYQLSWASRLTRGQGKSQSTSCTHALAVMTPTPYQVSQPLLAISRIISSRVGLQT